MSLDKKTNQWPKDATIIDASDMPLTDSGEPDIAAILAANGLGHIDLSKVKIMKSGDAE